MTEGSLFSALAALNQRFVEGAKPLPEQVDYGAQSTLVCFTLLGFELAVPLGEVAELVEWRDPTPLPRVKPWVLGLANQRGKLLPLVDLSVFLSGRPRTPDHACCVLIVDIPGLFIGLVVDRARGLRHIAHDSLVAELPAGLGPLEPYIKGYFPGESGIQVLLFNPLGLLNNEEFEDVVAW